MIQIFLWKNWKAKTLLGACALTGFSLMQHAAVASPKIESPKHQAKMDVRVVVLTAFEIGKDTGDQAGELQNWVEKYPLNKKIEAKENIRGHYFYNEKDHVLGVLLGEGHTSTAQSLTALLKDPRFDFTHAYFVLAGIAGGNPNKISVGSVALAHYVVNGGMLHMIDPRDMPQSWKDPYLPVQSSVPYPVPRPAAHSQAGDMVYHLNEPLMDWAFDKVAKYHLPDSAKLQTARKAYTDYPTAQKAPEVVIGDVISSEIFWAGPHSNAWAERWVDYWTEGKGYFSVTAMEDLAVPLVLEREAKAGLVDPKRLLVFRSVSNFDLPPTGQETAEMFKEGEDSFIGLEASVNNVYSVASVIVRELSEHWKSYKVTVPQSDSKN